MSKITRSRVKPADDDDHDAWTVESSDAKLGVKEQYARTTAGINNGFRYGKHPFGMPHLKLTTP